MTVAKKLSIAQLSDGELIELALMDNEKAYSVLFTRHQKVVKVVASRYLKSEQELSEVVQDTFIKAFRALATFRKACKFSSWLCKIAMYVAIDRYRQKQQVFSREGELEEVSLYFDHLKCFLGDNLEKQDLRQWIQRAIAKLTNADSKVIQLFYLQEQSIDEICAITGWTNSNVKSKLSRARIRLRKIIEEGFQETILN